MRWLLLLGLIGCGGGPSIPPGTDGSVPGGVGTLQFSWEVRVDGFPATCAEVGAQSVEIASDFSGGGSDVRQFPCQTTGNGASNPLQPGLHTFVVSLINAANMSILTLPPQSANVTNTGPTQLGLFIFDFGNVCDASSCSDGCCAPNGCVFAQSDTACGTGGVPCDNCAAIGLTCDVLNGFCTEP
jgi:hypothetical protein